MTDQIAETEGQYRQDRSRPRYQQNFRRGNFRGNVRNYGRQNSRGEYIEKAVEITVIIETETGLEKGHFPEIMAIIELKIQATVDANQDPELVQIGIEFIVISVGNMIILQGTVLLLGKKRRLNSFNKC